VLNAPDVRRWSAQWRQLLVFGCLTTVGLAQWRPAGPYGGAAELIRVVPSQPGAILAATRDGLLYETRDSGASWRHLQFPAQLSGTLHALAIDPRPGGAWYVGVEGQQSWSSGVYKSADSGRSWTHLPGLVGRPIWSLAIWTADPNLIAAGAADGVYLSKDAGENWLRISPEANQELRPVVSLAFHPDNANVIYAGTTHLPWRTLDGGATWQSIHAGMLDDSDVFSIQLDAKKPDVVFASACSGVYRSSTAGKLWMRLPTPRGAFRAYLVAIDSDHPGVVFAGTSAGLLRSADSGASWTRVTANPVKSVAFDPARPEKIFFASTTGGLLASTDDGTSVREINSGFTNRNFTSITGAQNVLYTNSIYEPSTGGIFRSSDSGKTWKHVSGNPANENILVTAAMPADPNRIFAAGFKGVLRSEDGGQSWVHLPGPPVERITALLGLPGKAGILAGTTAGLFRSTDAGAAWKPIPLSVESSSPAAKTGKVQVHLLQQSNEKLIAALTNSGAFFSSDGGAQWKSCQDPLPGVSWYGLALAPGGLALAGTSQGLFRSEDSCSSWSPVREGLDAGTTSVVILHPVRPGEAYAAQYGKVFRSKDNGQHWTALDDQGRDGSYPSALFILPAAPERLFALFPRRGVLFTTIGTEAEIAAAPQHSGSAWPAAHQP